MDAKAGARERLERDREKLIALSHRIHAHPEIGFEEERAAGWRRITVGRGKQNHRARPRQRAHRVGGAQHARLVEPGQSREATLAHAVERDGPRPGILYGGCDGDREKALSLRSRDQLRLEIGHRFSTIAIARKGPPLPPAIFIGSATTVMPVGGSRSRFARFSNAGTLCVISSTCDPKVVDCP